MVAVVVPPPFPPPPKYPRLSVVMGAHFGDNANSTNAVLRYANLNNAPSNSNTNIGSSLRDMSNHRKRDYDINCLGTGHGHGMAETSIQTAETTPAA